ncbi:MAG TPA: TonB-dependent receptor, partial [Longimicrobiales bacterium]|nr:TonB-dependent receptor [Longimicrobiales bacterium]
PATVSHSAAIFVFEELNLDPVRLHFGTRFDATRITLRDAEAAHLAGDRETRTFASISGSVGALYTTTGGFSIGASLARAFRTPDTNELFSQGPHLASYSFEIGNPDLDVETGIGADLFARINRSNLQGEIAAFRNWLRGYIHPRATGEMSRTGLPVYQHSGEDAVLTGIEGRIETHVGRGIVVDGTASWVRGERTRTGDPLPMVPPLSAALEARWERSAFFVLVGARLASAQRDVAEFETPTDGYAVFDAGAGYHWITGSGAHSVTLRVENLTDTVYRSHLSRIKDIMPEAGRGVTLLYRLHF